jgi:copper chaperone CopZ
MARELPTLGASSGGRALPMAGAPAANAPAAQPMAAGHDDTVAGTALARTELAITGMTCAACARRVSSGIMQGGSVADVVVNAATGRATVWYDASHVADTASCAPRAPT